jgi:hypothetical protein
MTQQNDNSLSAFELVGVMGMAETVKNQREEEKKTRKMPAHVKTFNPENPPYETQRLCIYLRELEEEKEKEELKKGADPTLHK